MGEELRELDAVVAEKVMGYEVRTSTDDMVSVCIMGQCSNRDWICAGERFIYHESKDHQPERGIPFYSTDIAAAIQIVEKMRERGWEVYMAADHPELWECEFSGLPNGVAWCSPTLPEAICRAALAAIEGKE